MIRTTTIDSDWDHSINQTKQEYLSSLNYLESTFITSAKSTIRNMRNPSEYYNESTKEVSFHSNQISAIRVRTIDTYPRACTINH